ncbi:MAG: 50S ribosomal protein L25 [Deltaproteobacteria bacterium]|nr:50S ribosomal protein L25 [Deltaproteobacteria bacterium]
MKKETLNISKREVLHKKVSKLRRDGIIPAVVYGKGFDSIPVQIDAREFESVYKHLHTTSIINLKLGSKNIQVLIHSLQKDKIKDRILHVDFMKVVAKEPVTVEVPIVLVGISPVEELGVGKISQETISIHVKCLPADIPEEIEVDISQIQTKDDVIHVSDLNLSEKISLSSTQAEDAVIATVSLPRVAEVAMEVEEGTEESKETAEGEQSQPAE